MCSAADRTFGTSAGLAPCSTLSRTAGRAVRGGGPRTWRRRPRDRPRSRRFFCNDRRAACPWRSDRSPRARPTGSAASSSARTSPTRDSRGNFVRRSSSRDRRYRRPRRLGGSSAPRRIAGSRCRRWHSRQISPPRTVRIRSDPTRTESARARSRRRSTRLRPRCTCPRRTGRTKLAQRPKRPGRARNARTPADRTRVDAIRADTPYNSSRRPSR